jgi:hypothetical protein
VRSESPLLGVLAGAILGLLLSVFVDWEGGLIVLGADLLVGAALRAVLPDLRLGLLAVRGRSLDVATLALAGGALLVISVSLGKAG